MTELKKALADAKASIESKLDHYPQLHAQRNLLALEVERLQNAYVELDALYWDKAAEVNDE